MELIMPDFLNKNLPAKERSQDLMDYATVPLGIAGLFTANPL